jgi:outer membrane protein TolC
MSKLLNAGVLSLAVAGVVVGIMGCGVGEPGTFDPRQMGEGERLASKDTRTYQMNPLPTTLESPYIPEAGPEEKNPLPFSRPTTAPSTGPSLGTEPQVRMTLQEIVHRAIANSNDIKVAGYQPAIDQTRVIEAEAKFDPTFFWNAQVQRIDKELAFAVAGASSSPNGANTIGTVQKETDYTASIGVRQQLESGGTIEFRNQSQITQNALLANNDTSAGGGSNSTNSAFGHNPALENEFVLEISQPLLNGFGNEINRARIVIARNNQVISLLDFRKQIEETIGDIEKNYWDLVSAEQVVEIQQDELEQAIDTAMDLQKRTGPGGDASRLQISQTEAQLNTRRSELIRAKQRVKDLSDTIKRDMNDPDYSVSGPIIIMPATPAEDQPVQFDPKDVIDTALANRFELGEQQLRVDSATTILAVGKNNLLPTLTAAGSVSLQGLSGSYAGILDDQLNHDYVSWSFGLEFEVPIGNRAARATYSRALLQRQQAVDSYAAAIATVTFDCKTAMNDVHAAWDALESDRRAAQSAADALQIEDERYMREPRTPELLQTRLNFQDTLASARRDESQSLAAYNQAIANLELKKGTLLQYNNIIMQEDAIPYERKSLPGR